MLTPEQARAKARELYADGSDDNIEIDDTALVNMPFNMPTGFDAPRGAWVAAWVWVPLDDDAQESAQ